MYIYEHSWILPGVCKCRGSESSHLSYIIFSSAARPGRTSRFLVPMFVCLHVTVLLKAVGREVKGQRGVKREVE